MTTYTPLVVECPSCGDQIAIPLTATPGEIVDGNLTVSIESDTADLWAHAWTHTINAGGYADDSPVGTP